MSAPTGRTWRAACPNCGAPVEFRSAASASAVCSFCRSTLVRDGEALRRIGTSAEVIDDHTPLQLGVTGRLDGQDFALVGRLQMGTEDGPWNEWRAVFADGHEGWLSEDNGRYVFAFDAPLADAPPLLDRMTPGSPVTVAGTRWRVASNVPARLLAAQGELQAPPPADRAFTVVDVRNERDEVGTLAADDAGGVTWSVGRPVALSALKLVGTRETDEKTLAARSEPCPNCGTPLSPTLTTAQTIVCPSCKSVVDLSKGLGPDMAHYAQENAGGAGPRIPLGSTGTLSMGGSAAIAWQAIGYQERRELDPDPGDEPTWHEYLLYHRTEGFAFLVETPGGWSWARVLTGSPEGSGGGVTWNGHRFDKLYEYDSSVTYVLGEFYWRVERGQRTHHADYAGRGGAEGWRLNAERTARELTWSGGSELTVAEVAKGFGLTGDAATMLGRFDAAGARGAGRMPPGRDSRALRAMDDRGFEAARSDGGGGGLGGGGLGGGGLGGGGGGNWHWLVILLVVLLVIVIVSTCHHDSCQFEIDHYGVNSPEYRLCRVRASSASTGSYGGGYGGSYGGYSSGGGGHK